ncbi:MAG: hypothetical protein R8K53_04695 [Mariprofundaceae bacterium]
MRALPFFHHHTGRMPKTVRWYLASIGMLSLLLLAAHFAVQEHVQKKMRTAVHAWLAETGGSVAHVRYRLLRGELTLEKLHLETAQIQLDAPLVFLQTSSQAMFAHHPSFTLIRFEQPRLHLARKVLSDWLLNAKNSVQPWPGMLPHVGGVLVSGMRAQISGVEMDEQMLLQAVNGRWDADGLMLDAVLDTGRLQLTGQVNENGELTADLAAQGVPLAALDGLGYDGTSAGSGELHIGGDWMQRKFNMQGEIRLQQEKDMPLIRVDGTSASGALFWRMQCSHVPLDGWSKALPEIAGRTLNAGFLDAELRFRRDAGQDFWHINMDGELNDVRLQGEGLPTWEIGHLQAKKLQFKNPSGETESKSFRAGLLILEDAALGFNVFLSAADAGTMPEIERLELKNIRPQLFFADDSMLDLPVMRGWGSLAQPHDRLKLSSGTKGSNEYWMLSAEGDFSTTYTAKVTTRGVPLVRLRPLLPNLTLPGERGVPEYAGNSDFSLSLTGEPGKLAAHGRAVLHDVMMTQGGDSLSAARVEADISMADTTGTRRLKQVTIKDWQYQSALHPLLRRATESKDDARDEMPPLQQQAVEISPPPIDAAQAMVTNPATWTIDTLVAEQGRISLGRHDAMIADQLSFSIRHLNYAVTAPFTLHGRFADGSLHTQGRLGLQPKFRMTAKTKITDMLPFAFNDWMRISGMPRFVRGRLDAALQIRNDRQDDDIYRGKLDVSLHQGALESGSFPADPLLERGGYSAQALLDRINRSRKATIAFPFRGRWDKDALLAHIGETGLAALTHAAEHASARTVTVSPQGNGVTRIRLQGKHGFSHNERVRLRHLIRQLKRQPELLAELVPQLAATPLEEETLARVRHSQRSIEKYLHRFGIARHRIYPVWPTPVHQRGDAPGIIIRARSL